MRTEGVVVEHWLLLARRVGSLAQRASRPSGRVRRFKGRDPACLHNSPAPLIVGPTRQ